MTLIGGNEMNETSENQNGATRRPYLAMWGIRDQLCSHGNAMVSGTTVGAAEFEALAQDVLPDVMLHDEDDTVLIDPRLWGELQPAPLLARVREAARAQPDLRLPADGDADTLLKRASLLRAVAAGQHPELGEEIARLVGQVCGEAGQGVRQAIDLAADKAPCKVDAALNDLVPFLDQLAPINLGDEGAPARLSARCEQVAGLGKWRNALPAPTFDSLRLSLLDDAQDAYGRALDRLVTERFEARWKKERDGVREHLEHYLETSRDFRAKVRLCTDDFENSSRRAKQTATALSAGNLVVLAEPGRDQIRAALFTHYKVASSTELIEAMRHDFEERLMAQAVRRGLLPGSDRPPFRRLILALALSDLVETFRALLWEAVAGFYSLYEACEAYGLERLVADLVRRSRITSWFNGRDHQRFGITRFEVKMVHLPAATSPKDVTIRNLLDSLFQQQGFQNTACNGHARAISVLRIYAGWPLGIEGGNGVLLESYARSRRSGHLPHLVGILPDSRAGEHAPGVLKLLDRADLGSA